MSLIARLLILSATMTVLISETSAQRGAPPSLPDGAGKELVMNVCSSCHSTALISRAAGYNTAAEWRRVFSTMVESVPARTPARPPTGSYSWGGRAGVRAGSVKIEITLKSGSGKGF